MVRTATLMMLAVALMLIIAAPAAAKEGLYLGANMLFNDISGGINSPEWVNSGKGLWLRGGFGLNRYLSFEAGLWETKHDLKNGGPSAALKAGTLDLKVNFPIKGSHIEPYLLVGYGSYTIEQNGFSEDGKGSRFGIGMDIYLFPKLSFTIGLTRNNVTFTHAGQDIDGKITSTDYGITYHFM